MPGTLGDDFASYLTAQTNVAVAQVTLATSNSELTQATATLHDHLVNSGVKALLAPAPNVDGSGIAVAVVNPDGTFSVIVAALPSTPVPAPPAPAPDPGPIAVSN